ncbi:hypothetical protein [Paenarthrobacter sp. PH39-S1]|uniref:hypothetical protein n=1 Tax=Paenarthrobacter sp. PH39-S1 TaxID=3046204 RepID=UPI0024BA543C|nr:hypothetical protein [Paenarthrobacter sp. PH39-S1]MDJ0357736.1 hypothetical protein [Paenarthrobacter sp. PH39-S1]
MSELFSHAAPEPSQEPASLQTITAEVTVPSGLHDAFEGFTDNVHLWWPMEDYSEFGVDSYLGFEDGDLVEGSAKGEKCLWARINSWISPSSFLLSWLLGGDPLNPDHVAVSFRPHGDGGTRVLLIHERWAPRSGAQPGGDVFREWPQVLDRYARFMGGSQDVD